MSAFATPEGAASPAAALPVRLHVRELHGRPRRHEAVRIGVPLARGAVQDPGALVLAGPDDRPVPWQGRALARWPDGSVKWLLVDALADAAAHGTATFSLRASRPADFAGAEGPALSVQEFEDRVELRTGVARFVVARRGRTLLASAIVDGEGLLDIQGAWARLTDTAGAIWDAEFEGATVEEAGPVRCTVVADGRFEARGQTLPLRVRCRATFTAGSGVVELEVLLHNPQAARHPGGLWDLGDPGSVRFEDLSLRLQPRVAVEAVEGRAEPDEPWEAAVRAWTLYQDGSGGEHWDCDNHVDADGRVTPTFRGWRAAEGPVPVTAGAAPAGVTREGLRATPTLRLRTAAGPLAASVRQFWQNFPKALRWDGSVLSVGLFPGECRAPYELQGGEQKRHVAWIAVGADAAGPGVPGGPDAIAALQRPLHAWVEPADVERSGAIPWFAAELDDPEYEAYVHHVIEGPEAFVAKRERIDEYGWRNFGDLYADHEAVNHTGPKPFVSHYNNQYDFVHGAAVHALRTGDPRWWELLHDCARHTVDIDLYHTQEDRAAFNGGLFWHTDHYKPAATATHRTYSRANGGGDYGGGPSDEHDYASGLLLYHWLTGDPEAAAAVVELAEWVIAMDDGRRTLLGLIDEGPTGLATRTVDDRWHKPGRGAGNSINTLLDAWQLTGERRYLDQAEALIQRCIHPADDVAALGLDQPEHRWSYLVFLQVLARYLELKREWGEGGWRFAYGAQALLAYARWLAQHEVPYKDVLHRVELPTETWPAHDVRKAHVLYAAARWTRDPDEAERFRARAAEFQRRALADVRSFATAYVTRPLVILAAYGYIAGHFRRDRKSRTWTDAAHRFGSPVAFVPQRERAKRALRAKARLAITELGRMVRGRLR